LILRRLWPLVRVILLGLGPCPDVSARYRMRRDARRLVTLATWPDMAATSADAAQLAMLRALDLQKKTRRAALLRQGEAATMLARSALENLFLGLYCHRSPGAISELHAGNLKAASDMLSLIPGVFGATEDVVKRCVAALGQPAKSYLTVRAMVEVIDKANGNNSALAIYRQFYGPLSNFTVHASGGTLMRHVGRRGRLKRRPSKSWTRRSAVRLADAAAGVLAADLAQHSDARSESLEGYANRHSERALLPAAVLAAGGTSRGSVRPASWPRRLATVKDTYRYLWKGQASADTLAERIAYVRQAFTSILNFEGTDLPPGALDPFIDYVAEMLATIVPAPA
jgi:hypothetical protein